MSNLYSCGYTSSFYHGKRALYLGKLTNREDVFLVKIINNMCSVILFFRMLCNFVFPGVLSFSWHVRHFYFPLMKKED